MTQEYIPFAQIVVEIGRLCRQRSTGTFFVATKANKSAQIVLDKGEIVYIFFSSRRGEEALALMSTIRAGRYRFQEGGMIPRRMDLPPTEDILAALAQGAARASSLPESGGRSEAVAGQLSQQQKDTLKSCLAECIGPMAAIICEDHLGAGKPLEETVNALAAEIPSGQVRRFRELVAMRLGA